MKLQRYKLRWPKLGLMWPCALLQLLPFVSCAGQVLADVSGAERQSLNVAVAANFAPTLRELTRSFEKETGIAVTVVSGSTGKHYAQILQGAPFDLFFAADQARPRILEQAGVAVAGSRFTYAIGRLVLWSREQKPINADTLSHGEFQHLAIANPRLAPYGAAAEAALKELGQWQRLQPKLVRGENINQTYHFVNSGAAELGLIALAQLQPPVCQQHLACWEVPERLHPAIEQQAVELTSHPAARRLMTYVQSPAGQAIIREHGYQVVGVTTEQAESL